MATVAKEQASRIWRRDRDVVSQAPQLSAQVDWMTRWTWAFLALGVGWRLLRYFMRFPIWGDESLFAQNLVNRDFAHALDPLSNNQVAPPLFVLAEWAALHYGNASELVMRLVPLCAGVLALILFKRLADKVVSPLGATVAVGILAVSTWTVSMSATIKPYSLDLLGTIVLLLPLVNYLQAPQQARWLWILTALVPVVLLSSLPALFIAPALSLALLAPVWRNRRAPVLAAFASFNMVCLITAVLEFVFYISRTTHSTMDGMLDHWDYSFPPAGVWPFVKWLLSMNTGQMFAYPAGDRAGGSTLTTLLFLIGVAAFWKEKRRPFAILCLVPFALALAAAAMHRYPYGGATRVHQHVVPLICLAVGAGLHSVLKKWAPAEDRQQKWARGICVGLALIATVGLLHDILVPYRHIDDTWRREIARTVIAQAQPNDLIVVNAETHGDLVIDWYLVSLRHQIKRLNELTDDDLTRTTGNVWILSYDYHEDAKWSASLVDAPKIQALTQRLERENLGWKLTDRLPYVLMEPSEPSVTEYCVLSRWSKGTPKRNATTWTP